MSLNLPIADNTAPIRVLSSIGGLYALNPEQFAVRHYDDQQY